MGASEISIEKLSPPPEGFDYGEANTVTRDIDAPAEVVWAAVSRPGHLKLVHPFCQENDLQRWDGVRFQRAPSCP